MRIATHIAVLIMLLGCFYTSCKKDDSAIQKKVYAGVSDDDFLYNEFSPALQVNIKWDSLNLTGIGTDSIDLNIDGDFDLFIRAFLLNKDSSHLFNDLQNPYPYYIFTLREGMEIASYDESFPVGLGQTAVATFADTLSYNHRVDLIEAWHNSQTATIPMWAENPGGIETPSFGGWYYKKGISYIGIKLSNKIGWIEVDNTNREYPVFTAYAILK